MHTNEFANFEQIDVGVDRGAAHPQPNVGEIFFHGFDVAGVDEADASMALLQVTAHVAALAGPQAGAAVLPAKTSKAESVQSRFTYPGDFASLLHNHCTFTKLYFRQINPCLRGIESSTIDRRKHSSKSRPS